MVNQRMAMWQGPSGTQRQAPELISGPIPAATIRLLSFNWMQSRFGTGLLTGYNTLRIHLYVMGLIGSPCVRGVEHRR
jgi:hypothetical protein